MCTSGLWSGDTSINNITNALIHSRVWSAGSGATIRCPISRQSSSMLHCRGLQRELLPCNSALTSSLSSQYNFQCACVRALYTFASYRSTYWKVKVLLCCLSTIQGYEKCFMWRPLHRNKILLVWVRKDKSDVWRVRLWEERMRRERNGKQRREGLSFKWGDEKCFECVRREGGSAGVLESQSLKAWLTKVFQICTNGGKKC